MNKKKSALLDKIRNYFTSHPEKKLSYEQLRSILKIPAFGRELSHLLEEGFLQEKGGLYALKGCSIPTVQGIFRAHRLGFGFVQPLDNSYPKDIFIPKPYTSSAVGNDTVEVVVTGEDSPKGPEGVIVGILKRATDEIAGTIIQSTPRNYLLFSPFLGETKILTITSEKKLEVGDRVVVQVTQWGESEGSGKGTFKEFLGSIFDPSIDVVASSREFLIRSEFPPEVIEEVSKYPPNPTKEDLIKRRDLTDLIALTIDPTTAKDYDDALSISKDSKGHYRLGVHIADVSYYVKPGTPLDKEASLRGNSTYFPGQCIPMLPEALSNNLCSLKPDVIRLVISVLMTFDSEGELKHYEIVRGYIKSRKRFTYEEAKKVLDKEESSPYLADLELLVELALLLKQKRVQRGSVDLAIPSVSVMVDEKGNPLGTYTSEYDITHQMVEDFMLKANEIVAKNLFDSNKVLSYRIHQEPDPASLKDFAGVASALGFTVQEPISLESIAKVLLEAQQTSFTTQLALSYVKSMRLAYYSPDNIGHYGLQLEYYTHFTSPIRRYIDLVIHRILFEETKSDLDIHALSDHCSERERISAKAESTTSKLKMLRLLRQKLKESPQKVYSAVITKVKPFGIFFEVENLLVEGFLHISETEDDYLIYEPEVKALIGSYSEVSLGIGDKIEVKLNRIDLLMQESHWSYVKKI